MSAVAVEMRVYTTGRSEEDGTGGEGRDDAEDDATAGMPATTAAKSIRANKGKAGWGGGGG